MRNVVIIGGGFGGLTAARALRKAPLQITLVDRRNHHLFQPLLYQVATAGLSPADIATPIRSILRAQRNVEVLMEEVVGIDRGRKIVQTLDGNELPFDELIIATGSTHSYFGHDDWAKFAPGLKSVEDATHIRRRVLMAFEKAEIETHEEKRRTQLTFIIVGGGPTGVEMAGSIAELAHQALRSDFRKIDPHSTRIILVEASPRILAAFPEDLAARAAKYLQARGVEIHAGVRVEKIDEQGVTISGARIAAGAVVWAAGVVASPAGKWLGAETDRAGRVKVEPDLSVPGSPNIFVIGDTASVIQNGKPVPGLAPAAMQQGRYVAQLILDRVRLPFHYVDKGNLATVGRSFAVADLGKIHLSGLMAWLAWLFVHIYYLIGFRNRTLVLLQWAWAYLTFQRGARLITNSQS